MLSRNLFASPVSLTNFTRGFTGQRRSPFLLVVLSQIAALRSSRRQTQSLIAPVHLPAFADAHPQRGGQAELTWAAGYIRNGLPTWVQLSISRLTGLDVE